MREYQNNPDSQLAFVLNLDQHWFTIRRFGRPHGKGYWFNLNSFLGAPEWVGNTYLGMVLQQAEREGYSVFAVRPVEDENPEQGLPETEADLLAETLTESAPGGQTLSTSRTHSRPEAAPATSFEDEDMELQRALQASLGYSAGTAYEFPGESSAPVPAPIPTGSRSRGGLGLGYGGDSSRGSSGPPSRRTPIEVEARDPPTPQFQDPDDPVAASAARAQRRLEQVQREQNAAMQAMGGYGFGAGMDEAIDDEGSRRRREAQERVRRAREEEEEQFRRAMAESLRAHEGQTVDVEGDDDFGTPPETVPPGGFGHHGNRNYDDEDAELQAALKASLEEHTVSVPASGSAPPASAVPVPRDPGPVAPNPPAAKPAEPSSDEEDEDEDEIVQTPAEEPKAEVADPDEVRRRRLARFGG